MGYICWWSVLLATGVTGELGRIPVASEAPLAGLLAGESLVHHDWNT
jgi:hypothetical protein